MIFWSTTKEFEWSHVSFFRETNSVAHGSDYPSTYNGTKNFKLFLFFSIGELASNQWIKLLEETEKGLKL